jgi:hypothetical protein
MNNHSFEKPREWGIAPKETWVSGTPIGQSEVKMPSLGDPGGHKDFSAPLSLEPSEGAIFRGRRVSQCPPGMSNKGGICTPDPSSQAKPESKIKAIVGDQWGDKEGEERNPGEVDPSLSRDLPEAPMRGIKSSKGRSMGHG